MERKAHKAVVAVVRTCEERYRRLFESINDAVFLRPVTLDGPTASYIEVNAIACKWLGYSREELLQKTPLDIDPYVSVEALDARTRRLLTEDSLVFETALKAKNGRLLPVEISSHMFECDGNKMMLSIARDLTERKTAERALRESERRFREMMENVRLISIMLDAEGRILFANQFLLELTAWSCEEVLGKSWFDLFIPSDDVARLQAILGSVLSGQPALHIENEILTRDGQRRLIAWNNTSLKDETGKVIGVASIGEDITARKAAENALRASAEQFRNALESAPEGIFVQTDGRFDYLNHQAARQFGATSPEDLLGQPVLERHPFEAHAEIQKRIDSVNLRQCAVPLREEQCLRLDGTRFPSEVTAVPFAYEGKQGALVFFRDITDRKHLEEQLRQAQKLEAIGQLAGGVAHDFNNILAAMMMQLGMLRSHPKLDVTFEDDVREIETHAQRAADLTRQLLLFSRRSVMQVKPLDLNELIENLLKMLRRLLGEHIDVHFHPKSALPPVRADAGMVEQVVMNLAVNARDAMPKGGRLTISTDVAQVEAPETSLKPERCPGHFVLLSVADTGVGMDEATCKRIFEPFFTTKEVGRGTGLGLATVYGIVSQHEGWLKVQSELGKGSSFQVALPAQQTASLQVPHASPPQPAHGGCETILLVEDEPAVRQMVGRCLLKYGYRVIEATNGREALAFWPDCASQVDLLLTDMVLPGGTSGLELAQLLRKEKPGLRVVVSSGYSAEMTDRGAPTDAHFVYLPKPFQAATLASAVRKCLDAR